MRRFGIAAMTALSLYGAGNLVSDMYHYLAPKSEPVNNESYKLFLGYCDPERNYCKSTITPVQMTMRRASDNRILWDATIESYPNSSRPYVKAVWSDPELSDRLGGELTFDLIGGPSKTE